MRSEVTFIDSGRFLFASMNWYKKINLLVAFFVIFFFQEPLLFSYPLDGTPNTDITRLEGYLLSLKTPSGQRYTQPGQQLSIEDITLSLDGQNLSIPSADRALSAQLKGLLPHSSSGYGVSIFDFSDPTSPTYMSVSDGRTFIPASTGKVLVGVTLFHALKKYVAHDVATREEVLRNTQITADSFIVSDSHVVPFWNSSERRLNFRPVQEGDVSNLWTFLDWMMSASSNAAASTLMKHVLLMHEFKESYPPTLEQERAYFQRTSASKRASLITRLTREAISSNGLNPGKLVQSSLFTKGGKKEIPSRGSTASPREFVKLFLKMEQGRLIDRFSSLELKRLLYNTQRRTRYAASAALNSSAVYHKSGSLFKCRPESGFVCDDYMGNVRNLLSGITLVEYPAGDPKLRYIVAVTSNILKIHSPTLHSELARRIHSFIAEQHGISQIVPQRRVLVTGL